MPDFLRGEIYKGYSGEEVLAIRSHLERLGYKLKDKTGRIFDEDLEDKVRQFQSDTGLRIDGICGPQTWSRMLESGHSLGDRILYRRTPMVRGDDVALLQDILNKLGFSAGRVDGIFGDDTLNAVKSFQEHAGLAPDGIVGAKTLKTLYRLTPKQLKLTSVAQLREDIAFAKTTQRVLNVTISELSPCQPFLHVLQSHLGAEGFASIALGLADQSALAEQANALKCDLALSFQVREKGAFIFYYKGFNYESAKAKELAGLLAAELNSVTGANFQAEGKSFPFLRETSMTACLIELPSIDYTDSLSAKTAQCIAKSITHWLKPQQEIDSLDSTT